MFHWSQNSLRSSYRQLKVYGPSLLKVPNDKMGANRYQMFGTASNLNRTATATIIYSPQIHQDPFIGSQRYMVAAR